MATPGTGGRLAILGAGHAHMEVIRRLRPLTHAGVEVTIVDQDDFWYSGLATGMLGGQYEVEHDRISVETLARRVGARFLRDRVTQVDPAARVVHLTGGASLAYDVASLDLGSCVPVDRVEGLGSNAFLAKPIRRLAKLRADLTRRVQPGNGRPGQPPRILVIGGGATACEIALNLRALADRLKAQASITLVTSGDRLLSSFPESASRTLTELLDRRAVAVRTGDTVARVEPDAAVLSSGGRIDYDLVVAAIGLVAPPVISQIGLPTNDEGRLLLDPFLRSVQEPTLFAGGDCATLEGVNLPQIGVVAVRQARVLAHNLRATILGGRLRRYRPQRRWLQILNLGDGTGLACWGAFSLRGRAMLAWKDLLDRNFLRQLR
ncbi:NAD(P)/FAD-dependent oxidoreductase [Tautonia marina]|uniref:NAD(P)/FAD-dependent oxidoreductase n=1 Tax=Tautonia marina TaxID=2653855 RepID=UPI001260A2BA|nr:FAD-dependent oxidoreductase [Tautonia marina]